MINRRYFAYATSKTLTASTIITHKSWFPNQNRAYNYAIDYFTNALKTDRFSFVTFNKI